MYVTGLTPNQLSVACSAIKIVEFHICIGLAGPKPPHVVTKRRRQAVAVSTCAAITMLMQESLPLVPYRCSLHKKGDRPVRTDVHVFIENSAPQAHILMVGGVCQAIGNKAAEDAADVSLELEERMRNATPEMRADMLRSSLHHLLGTHH